MQNEDSKVSTLTVINGGVEIEVEYLNGSKELIKVRQLPLRHMAAYGGAQGDEATLCELFTARDTAWVDSLTTESQEMIVTVGDELNSSFFIRWAERRLAANKKLLPMTPALASAKSASPSSPAAGTPPLS